MKHVIVGAGPVGSGTAQLLVAAGHEVTVVTRSGNGPEHPGIERVRADAADAPGLARLAAGAAAIYNCANPPYHRWAAEWPPIAASLLAAAESSGAVLVTTSNLYGYGEVSAPMTESTPLTAKGMKGWVRNEMWRDALAAHVAGRARVCEARASDYFGPGLTATSHMADRVIPNLLAGKPVRLVLGTPDVLHSWTYIDDVARTLVVLGTDGRAWGRVWHVPTNPPLTQRQMVGALAAAAGVDVPRVRALPPFALRSVGIVSPTVRQLQEVRHQFERPFVVDSTACSATFGLDATPMDEALRATIGWWRRTPTPDRVLV
jgi:nucleoside-diphosphate-sugar epimerase